mmetsp:Transcript_21779/g.39048  ORF Transcript_21779/g.39048 Transcript_21779/m.39048 type:complete len:254 (+) Transcript_21779:115-876(+)|eukprot:CAMPEP_0197654032 /NCGR_PEP_ID=MMETSP1338-20131121/38449_1 /TAXON_ID=43686 ORGANISM="Pelagodinium beii, Strain RCC1491" /NCGR_SAMPLE_ID=MMETSP1338 /ASSEMBLY_ACC=CAM_ASM_000754 /LENGTH=253 /DNA_ID=CAMNT_0043229399 /DNA_START=111 /DNA_END=872 /DNA_ORIENTATION=-
MAGTLRLCFLVTFALFQQTSAVASVDQRRSARREDPESALTAETQEAKSHQNLDGVLAQLRELEKKLNKKQAPELTGAGKVYVWTKNVSSAPGPSYFHCLKRFGPYAMWALPAGSPFSPPNQPCTAFYVKKFMSDTDSASSYIDNAICTRDDWCLNGVSIANTDAKMHGVQTNGRTPQEAVKFELIEGNSRSVRAYLNTNPKKAMPEDDNVLVAGGWQCIQRLTISDAPKPDMGLKLTADDSSCADIDLGWVE